MFTKIFTLSKSKLKRKLLSSNVYAKVYVVFTRVQSAAGTFPLCIEKMRGCLLK